MNSERSKPIRRVSSRKYRGAGDVVAKIAKPVARFVDSIFGTDLENCRGCGQRQDKMNKKIPFGLPKHPEKSHNSNQEIQ